MTKGGYTSAHHSVRGDVLFCSEECISRELFCDKLVPGNAHGMTQTKVAKQSYLTELYYLFL